MAFYLLFAAGLFVLWFVLCKVFGVDVGLFVKRNINFDGGEDDENR